MKWIGWLLLMGLTRAVFMLGGTVAGYIASAVVGGGFLAYLSFRSYKYLRNRNADRAAQQDHAARVAATSRVIR